MLDDSPWPGIGDIANGINDIIEFIEQYGHSGGAAPGPIYINPKQFLPENVPSEDNGAFNQPSPLPPGGLTSPNPPPSITSVQTG